MSLFTLGQPLVLVATRPWYSACWVARTLGICVASVAPICSTAFGSSAPAAKMPRGREYLKLRPTMSHAVGQQGGGQGVTVKALVALAVEGEAQRLVAVDRVHRWTGD